MLQLKACLKCRGDLALDEGDWKCLQCARYYYVALPLDSLQPVYHPVLLAIDPGVKQTESPELDTVQ